MIESDDDLIEEEEDESLDEEMRIGIYFFKFVFFEIKVNYILFWDKWVLVYFLGIDGYYWWFFSI